MNIKKVWRVGLFSVLFLGMFAISPSSIFAFTNVTRDISSDTTWTLEGSPYVVKGLIFIDPDVTLNIEPGVVIKFKNASSGINLNGTMVAHGTSEANIYFTSIKDDTVGGDTNLDGSLTSPATRNWDRLYVTGIGKCDFSNVVLRYGGLTSPGSVIESTGTLIISDSKFSNDGLGVYQEGGTANITRTEFFDQSGGYYVRGGEATISYSSFHNNFGLAAGGFFAQPIIAINNYWGDPTGPYHPDLNPSGKGDKLAKGIAVNFIPWLTYDPLLTPPPPTGNSNVMFLPGLEASRLYKRGVLRCEINCEDQLWEPNIDSDVEFMFLNPDGTSINKDIYTRDVVDNGYGLVGIYGSFLDTLEKMKSVDHTIADFSAIPYDWRLSLNDILNNGKKDGDRIYYSHGTSTDPYILSELRRLQASSQNKKVTIVAHSNGGLVTKALLKRLADTNDPLLDNLDKVILVAVPQIGTPEAIGALLHGYDQGLPLDSVNLFLTDYTASKLAVNSQAAYNLLPSENYFKSAFTPVVTFGSSLPDWNAHFGDIFHSEDRLHNFLIDDFIKGPPLGHNTNIPQTINSGLLTQAEAMHDELDKWQIPAKIPVIEIAGWGVPSTVSSIEYNLGRRICQDELCSTKIEYIVPKYKFTIDGDGTVVTPSALYSAGENTTRYWVNLKKYNFFLNNIRDIRRDTKHAGIMQVPDLIATISNIIKNDQINVLPQYISTSTPLIIDDQNRLAYSLHSPLTLNIYDSIGNHTGISTSTGQIEEQIPGSYFEQIGDAKYIFIDNETPVNIVMNGYDSGTFTFNIDELQGDTLLASTTFKDIPTSTTTTVRLSVGGGITSASPMQIDKDSDGNTDITLVPKLNDIVTLDVTPPETSSTLSGLLGKNNWYTDDVTLSINPSDTESGIARTFYSFDEGQTWSPYSSSTPLVVSDEGTTTVQYYSVDNFGNIEAPKSFVIKIDKTPPEISFSVDPISRKLSATGIDALSRTTVMHFATSTVVTDNAGHTTQTVYKNSKLKEEKNKIDLAISEIIYDGVSQSNKSSLKYEWEIGKNNAYKSFQSHIKTKDIELESEYEQKKDTTSIEGSVLKKNGVKSEDSEIKMKLPGMVIMRMKTNKGDVIINY